jgi:disulfide bond formation protein DsbB
MTLTTRVFAVAVLTTSAVVLGTALLSQYWGGLRPCELCLLQRWPWDAAIAISLVAAFAGGRAALPWVALVLVAVFAVGVVFAFYHVGVEQHWFAGPSACTSGGGQNSIGATTLEEMKRQILGTAPVLCDQVQWSLFGVSLAGLNLLASLGMAAFCVAVFARTRRPASRSAVAA